MAMQAVTVNNLTKAYTPGKNALDSIDFSLEAGDIFGFLGPNGAGKTTAVKLLAGMLTPTAGSCSVFGMDPAEKPEQVHSLAGVVTEHALMYDNMTGLQNLLFFGALFGQAADTTRRKTDSLLEQLALTDAKDKKLSAYSTGMRQRLSLARAMLHNPKILFLDEPTSGLDPESAKNVNDMIANLARENGTTVFLCTHQLRYAQELCTCYGLVAGGVLLAKGTLEELRADVSPGITVSVRADRIPDDVVAQEKQNGYFDIHISTEEEIPAIVRKIVSSGGNVYHVSTHKPTLEEIYFALLDRRDKAVINSMQMALIKKDIRSVTGNKRLFSVMLIVPLVMVVVLPTIFMLTVGFTPVDSPDFQELVSILPDGMLEGDLRESLIRLLLNDIISVFFLLIPIMAASVVSASSFVGEKEKRTLETLLYCPLSLRQIFSAKIIASFALSQIVSLISFAAMLLVVQIEIWFIIGGLILPGVNWLVLLLLVSPALALVSITLIVRGSAKAKTMEESQQRSIFLILPIILLAALQFTGLLMVSAWMLLAIGILCVGVGIMLLRRSSASFHYERLLL